MKLKSILKILYIMAALGFMAYYIVTNWASIQPDIRHFNFALIAVAAALFWIALAGPVLIFKLTFRKLADVDFSWGRMFSIFNLSFIGRYLPGKVWSAVGMVYYAGEFGIGRKKSTLAVIVNEICFKVSGLILGSCFFIFSPAHNELIPAIILVVIAGMILIHPRLLEKVINFGLRIFRKQPVEIDMTYSSLLMYFLLYLVFWAVYGLGFYSLVEAIVPLGSINILKFVAILPLAWSIGYLALFAPGGLGVREGVLVVLLAEYLTPEIALVTAIVQRIISMLIEGINVLIALIIARKEKT